MTNCHDCNGNGNGRYTLAVSDDGFIRCLACEAKHCGVSIPKESRKETGVIYASFMETMRRARTMNGRRLA